MIRLPVYATDTAPVGIYAEFNDVLWDYLRERAAEAAENNCMMLPPKTQERHVILFMDQAGKPCLMKDATFVYMKYMGVATG